MLPRFSCVNSLQIKSQLTESIGQAALKIYAFVLGFQKSVFGVYANSISGIARRLLVKNYQIDSNLPTWMLITSFATL